MINADFIRTKLSLISTIVVFILIAAFVSCSSSKKASKPRNFDSLYNPSIISLFPDIQIASESENSSLVNIRIRQQELLFNQANKENKLQANLKITYHLFEIGNSEQLSDSGTISYSLDKNPSAEFHFIDFSIPAKVNANYFIEIKFEDLNRKSERTIFKTINRDKKTNQQDIVVKNPETQELYFDPFIKKDQPFEIKHYKLEFDSLFVFFYKNKFSTPLPPNRQEYIQDSLNTPDTTFIFYPDSVNYDNFKAEGIYYFSFEQFAENGFALFNFGPNYPNVVSPCQLYEPLNYLTNIGNCYDDTTNGRMTKLAVDNFWLSKAKNINRSRELIKIFYTRVMFANSFFTSYKPGWQTDRGMIYTIYGPPDYLYKSAKEERWIYSPRDLGPGVVFNFEIVPHKFSTNHFILNRSKQKITGWDEAVKMWNSGEVFYFQP